MSELDQQIDEELLEITGGPIGVEIVQCVTTQWNHPYAPHEPFASGGRCSQCGQLVDMVRYAPDRPSLYSHTARPHYRVRMLYRVDGDTLRGLLEYRKMW